MASELKKVLMERDGMTSDKADKKIESMRKQVFKGKDPENILYKIGLEPDYIFDII